MNILNKCSAIFLGIAMSCMLFGCSGSEDSQSVITFPSHAKNPLLEPQRFQLLRNYYSNAKDGRRLCMFDRAGYFKNDIQSVHIAYIRKKLGAACEEQFNDDLYNLRKKSPSLFANISEEYYLDPELWKRLLNNQDHK